MTDQPPAPDEELVPEAASAQVPLQFSSLADAFPEAQFELSVAGQQLARVESGRLVEFVQAARDAGFEMFIDLTAVDYYRQRPGPRFDIVVGLLSLKDNLRLRILVAVDGDVPSAPSITGVYPGANFYEREVYDLFGIDFTGHPDLTRIMLPDDWEGHPLRKDTAVGAVPIQFRDANKVL